jgi:acetyl-CoA carboxylase biotin carboxyl carrier protein
MTLTHEDVRKILAILDESDYEEVHIEFGDLKLDLRRRGDSSEVQQVPRKETLQDNEVTLEAPKHDATETTAAAAPVPSKTNRQEALPEGVAEVVAPMLGTCYRAPSPGAKPFVEVGAKVNPDDTVCLIEVMKLFNSLRAGVAGTVETILFENATLVEYGQPLILIRKEVA